jgi:hypothetical protein
MIYAAITLREKTFLPELGISYGKAQRINNIIPRRSGAFSLVDVNIQYISWGGKSFLIYIRIQI